MNTKIIFFDIDGTILSHRTLKISESTRTAIRKARDNGHLAFINTGRTQAQLNKTITEVGFDGCVCGCGTYIEYHEEVLLHSTIPSDICRTLAHDLHEYQLEALLEGPSAVYYDDRAPISRLLPSLENLKNHYHFNMRSWYSPDLAFDKFCIWCDEPVKFNLFKVKYGEMFDVIDRGDCMYEVIPKGHSKASGIEFLMSHLHIPHENTYAFGDGANDLPMLRYVKHSIGMGNADGGVPEIVSFLTRDVDEDGIEYALKHYKII